MQVETRRLLHIKGRDITFSTINPSPNSLADGDILFVNSKGRSRNLRLYAKHLRKLWYVPLINVSNANLTGDLVDTESIQTMTNKSFMSNVGIGTQAPHANVILDLSSKTKAFRPPSMTTTQRDAISSPAEGSVIYNTSTNVLNFYNGSAWGAV